MNQPRTKPEPEPPPPVICTALTTCRLDDGSITILAALSDGAVWYKDNWRSSVPEKADTGWLQFFPKLPPEEPHA